MTINWTTIEKQFVDWLENVTNLPREKILIANQNPALPLQPFVLINPRFTFTKVGQEDYIEDNGDGTLTIYQLRNFKAIINFYGSGSLNNAELALNSIELPSIYQDWNGKGIVITSSEDIMDLTFIEENRYTERALIEMDLQTLTTVIDDVGYFDKVEITSNNIAGGIIKTVHDNIVETEVSFNSPNIGNSNEIVEVTLANEITNPTIYENVVETELYQEYFINPNISNEVVEVSTSSDIPESINMIEVVESSITNNISLYESVDYIDQVSINSNGINNYDNGNEIIEVSILLESGNELGNGLPITIDLSDIIPLLFNPSNITDTSFTATWSSVNGATSYEIDVTDDNYTTFIIQNLNVGDVLTYIITGLDPDTNYEFRIRAKNDISLSENSTSKAVDTLLPSTTIINYKFFELSGITLNDSSAFNNDAIINTGVMDNNTILFYPFLESSGLNINDNSTFNNDALIVSV